MIEAQENLVLMGIMDFPHMKAEARRKLHKNFHILGYPRTHDTTQRLNTVELAEKLRGLMRGK